MSLAIRLLTLLVILAPAAADARMGGGENYGGGSSGSSSSSSSTDGGAAGELSPETFMAVFGSLAGVSLTLIAVSIVVKARRRRTKAARYAASIALFREADPDFDPDALIRRTREVFLRCQDAWFRRDLGPVRTLMSDASFQRLRTQLALMHAQGVRDAIADVTVDEVELLELTRGSHFDTVKLRIRGYMKDTEVPAAASDEEARRAAAATGSGYFSEDWSFVRRPGIRSRREDGLLDGRCPNCGAPLARAETNACSHCNAIVNSGNFDWTLAEITQVLESDTSLPESQIPGLAEARASDPALDVQVLEDRAALIFWRGIDAKSNGEARRLAKVAAPELVASLARDFPPRRFVDCAVGAVNLRSIRREGERQLAEVEVRWSSRPAASTGEPRPEPALRHSRLTLGRSAAARTRTDEGMSTSRCPGCRAPLTDSLTAACDYCGRALGVGDDWVLVAERGWFSERA